MTSSEVYWIMQLDTIRIAVGCSIAIMLIGATILTAVAMEKKSKIVGVAAFLCWLMFFVFIVAIAFIPSTKDAAAAYIIPKVMDSEVVAEEMPELYDIAKSALSDMAGKKTGEKAKEKTEEEEK